MPFGQLTPTIRQDRPSGADLVGTVVAKAGLSLEEYGMGILRHTVFTLSDMPLTITDALAYASQQLYDFPLGRIHVLAAVGTIQMTTTSAIASTLNSAAVISWGLGSAAASSITLATTMINFMPGSGEAVNTFTSSTVINVAATADDGMLAAVAAAQIAAVVNGTSTAADLFLNLGIPTNTEIDADATVTIDAKFRVTWFNEGIVGLA